MKDWLKKRVEKEKTRSYFDVHFTLPLRELYNEWQSIFISGVKDQKMEFMEKVEEFQLTMTKDLFKKDAYRKPDDALDVFYMWYEVIRGFKMNGHTNNLEINEWFLDAIAFSHQMDKQKSWRNRLSFFQRPQATQQPISLSKGIVLSFSAIAVIVTYLIITIKYTWFNG